MTVAGVRFIKLLSNRHWRLLYCLDLAMNSIYFTLLVDDHTSTTYIKTRGPKRAPINSRRVFTNRLLFFNVRWLHIQTITFQIMYSPTTMLQLSQESMKPWKEKVLIQDHSEHTKTHQITVQQLEMKGPDHQQLAE